ncbi:MAG: hypothetical protein WC139_13390 [Candidatus Kapaibacterium sp.]
MKNLKFYLPVSFAIISMLMLSSCLNIDRKIKINADGSGTESQTFNIDRTFYDLIYTMVQALDSTRAISVKDSLYNHDEMLKPIRTNLSSKEGIELISLTGLTNEDSSATYKFEYNFDNVAKIGYATNISAKDVSAEKENKSEIVWNDNGNTVNFSLLYKPDPGDDINQEENTKAFSFLFANKNVNFEIEFPYEIESSNAINVTGNKGVWTFPVSELMLDKTKKLYIEAVLRK